MQLFMLPVNGNQGFSLDKYADGTFKTVPALFEEIYTLLGIDFHNVVPLVYALLPDKKKIAHIKEPL